MSPTERLDSSLCGSPDSGAARAAPGDTSPPGFQPHSRETLDGVLVSCDPIARSRTELERLALPALTGLVADVTQWPEDVTLRDAYLGDYRFLVVEFDDSVGVSHYVQIWSEPGDAVLLEVGPGERAKPQLQAAAARMAPALLGRGFEIGGNAHNFQKRLATPTGDELPRNAREILGLILDVHGYDGRADLKYRMKQGSFLRPAHVLTGIGRSQLTGFLRYWGLNPHVLKDSDRLVTAQAPGVNFVLTLHLPRSDDPQRFWELHGRTTLLLPVGRVTELLTAVNGDLNLFKAYPDPEFSVSGQSTTGKVWVALKFAINFAGGVTLEHIRSEIFEWLAMVDRWRRESHSPRVLRVSTADGSSTLRPHRSRPPHSRRRLLGPALAGLIQSRREPSLLSFLARCDESPPPPLPRLSVDNPGSSRSYPR